MTYRTAKNVVLICAGALILWFVDTLPAIDRYFNLRGLMLALSGLLMLIGVAAGLSLIVIGIYRLARRK